MTYKGNWQISHQNSEARLVPLAEQVGTLCDLDMGLLAYNLGLTAQKLGKKIDAIGFLEVATRRAKCPWEGYIVLGKLYIEQGYPQMAEQTLKRMLNNCQEHKPRMEAGLILMGITGKTRPPENCLGLPTQIRTPYSH